MTSRTRAAARRERVRRRRRWAAAAVTTVVTVIAALVVVRLAIGPGTQPTAFGADGPFRASMLAVPASTLDAVGPGWTGQPPQRLTGQPALTRDGRPLVVYIGAEYCPFCAAQRWPIVVALYRFGTFTGLGTTHSALDDAYRGTATLSFHGAKFTSQYLAFDGIETASNVRRGGDYAPLDPLTAQQRDLMTRYNPSGGIPFLDLGNAYTVAGASLDPAKLAGLSTADIAAALADPATPVAQAILGPANTLTAALCDLTDGQPAAVCTSPGVQAVQAVQHDG